MLCGLVRYSCIYEAHTSPALNGSSAIWHFKHSDVMKIRNRIIDFYIGLPHIHTYLPIYVHKYMHKYICTYIQHTYIHTTYIHTYNIHTTYIHTYIPTYIHTTYIHVHTTISGIIMVGYVFLNFGNVVRDIINNMHVQIIRS